MHPAVTFIQPYVPEYRVPFFDELARRLGEHGYQLQVVHSSPRGSQAARADARLGVWSVPVRARTVRLGSRILNYRPVMKLVRRSSVVVAELASTNLDTYLLALNPSVRLMLWGHGKAYVTKQSGLDTRLELWLARHATRVFVYTEGGAEHLRLHGYEPARITVVRNSTDARALRCRAATLTRTEVRTFREEHRLGDGPIAAFVGSHDESKSLPLLFEAAELIHQRLPEFRLIVAGAGPLQGLVEAAATRLPFIRPLPRADQDGLARIGAVADCLLIPGRVGLVAVDALTLGLPVVTTTYPFHAPEFDYLTDEVSVVTAQDANGLAAAVTTLLTDPPRLKRMSSAAEILAQSFGIEAMSEAFVAGLLQPVPLA